MITSCLLILNATVYLPDGPIADTTILVDGGKIVHVGPTPDDLRLGDGVATWRGTECELVASGGVVTAGLVEVASQLGVVEVGAEGATRDGDAEEGDPIRAALRVSDAYNPRATAIPVSRLGGLTSAVVAPAGGLVSGQSAWVDLAGATQRETVIRPSVAVQAGLGATGSRAGDLNLLREVLEEARLWARLRTSWQNEQIHPEGVSHLDLEALQPVLKRTVPLVVVADRASDIEALLRLAREQEIRLVIQGGAEAWLVADALAEAKVPVIVDPLVYGAGGFDQVQGRADNAALLVKAGVPVVLSSFSTHNARVLRQSAGNAVRGGLDHDAALRAITQTPAEVFGIADHGRIATGAVANLVVWSGDPLELSSHVDQLLIGGRVIALESRQTELRDKYRQVPGTPLAPLDPATSGR